MFYCENCGAELREGWGFCEQCGTPISAYAITGSHRFGTLSENLFSCCGWKELWVEETFAAENEGAEIGILLTNTKKCNSTKRLEAAISKFITYKRKQGVRYYCLNLATEAVCGSKGKRDIENVLAVLRRVYTQRVPDYLLILGDTASVGAATWKNCADHCDAYVTSDLPYLTMDLISPWEGRRFDFRNAAPTGRLPGRAEDGFADACCYLENIICAEAPNRYVEAFGLSALQWRELSEGIYANLGRELLLSPDITVEDFAQKGIAGLNNGVEPNLLYFNLHGSNLENYWYGQKGNHMPRAFASAYLPKRNGYVIGAEACYGAIQMDQKQPSSILLEALRNGCIAFVGSNTVAFGGARRGRDCCADVIVHRFLHEVKNGAIVGSAFLTGLEELCSALRKDDALIKTCAQFALYADPSAALVDMPGGGRRGHRRKISVAVPDVQSAVRMSLTKVSEEIESRLRTYVGQYHSEFSNTVPVSYMMQDGALYQSMYSKEQNGIPQVLKLYYDACGTVIKEYVTR